MNALNTLTATLKDKLATDTLWAAKALVRILGNQTYDERACKQTLKHNGVGFSGADAKFGTSLAEQAQQWFDTPKEKRKHASPFSANQAKYACKMAKKYAKQIAVIMLAENPEAAYKLIGMDMPETKPATKTTWKVNGVYFDDIGNAEEYRLSLLEGGFMHPSFEEING